MEDLETEGKNNFSSQATLLRELFSLSRVGC